MIRIVSLGLIAALFVGAGVLHFVRPTLFERIVPAWLPAARALVLWSGAFEILGGLGVLVPALRAWAGWGLIALLVAVFPANVNMALHPELTPKVPEWALWARLPLQVVLIGWVWWATRAAP